MKKRVLSVFLIMAILVSSFYVNGVTNSVEAKSKSQSYHIKKGKIYNKKNKLVKKKIVKIKKKKYYADKKGRVVKKKIFKYKKAKYYAQKNGALAKSKIVTYKGKKYYAQKNYKIARDKIVTVKGKIYYANKDGVLKYLIDKKEYDANKKTDDSKSNNKKSDDSKTDTEKGKDNSEPSTGAPIEYYEPLFPHDDAIGYLTPQMFDAKGDGKTDDTEAFRKLFKAAYDQGFNSRAGSDPGWRHCKSIFIPAGKYIIKDAILRPESPFPTAPMFEVSGAGREATTINFIGSDVLFDNQNVFGFTTFRDIEFKGTNSNIFMNFKNKHGSGIAQRLQFISCSFVNWNQIIKCINSDQMLSEVTFAYCKISSCGSLDNPCTLFTFDCTQAVNWRFDFTDIESFHGDCFYFIQGSSVCIVGGSIIPLSGNVVNFNLPTSEQAGGAGPGNAYHALFYGSRFEIKNDNEKIPLEKRSCLVRTNTFAPNTASVKFDSCGLCTLSNNSPNFMVINGSILADFNNCQGCNNIRINGDVTKEGWYNPRLRFTGCQDLNVQYMVNNSTIINNKSDNFDKNCVRVMVDNSYDFYIGNKTYIKTISGLSLCRQDVKLSEYKRVGLENGKIIEIKNPLGYVESAEVKVLKNETYGDNYPVTMAIYKGDVKVNEVTLKFGADNSYSIPVKQFGDDIKIKFTHSHKVNPNVDMNVALIKY